MTYEEWIEIGLFPRAYRPWHDGKLSKIEIKQRPDGKWLAVAGKVHLCRGQKDEATTKAMLAKLKR